MLSTALVNSKSSLNCSLTFCSESALVTKNIHLFWQQFSVIFLMAVTNFFIYCQQANVNNATRKNSLKETKHQTTSLLGQVTKAAGIKVFFDPKKMRGLSQKQVVQLSIQERALTQLAPGKHRQAGTRFVKEISQSLLTLLVQLLTGFDPFTSTWPHLRCDVGPEEVEY